MGSRVLAGPTASTKAGWHYTMFKTALCRNSYHTHATLKGRIFFGADHPEISSGALDLRNFIYGVLSPDMPPRGDCQPESTAAKLSPSQRVQLSNRSTGMLFHSY
jgi:hypothetical protein